MPRTDRTAFARKDTKKWFRSAAVVTIQALQVYSAGYLSPVPFYLSRVLRRVHAYVRHHRGPFT